MYVSYYDDQNAKHGPVTEIFYTCIEFKRVTACQQNRNKNVSKAFDPPPEVYTSETE